MAITVGLRSPCFSSFNSGSYFFVVISQRGDNKARDLNYNRSRSTDLGILEDQ